jgi:hypothetical protein
MTYNPSIPQASDKLVNSQVDLLTNFTQLNTVFNNDHYKFNNGAGQGQHRQINFPLIPAVPVVAGAASAIYPKLDLQDAAANPALFFTNQSTTFQITNAIQSIIASDYSKGYYMFPGPGGLILQWGTADISSAGQYFIFFNTMLALAGSPAGFPNKILSVNYTVQCDTSVGQPKTCIDETSPPQKTKFKIRVSPAVPNSSIFWIALGV